METKQLPPKRKAITIKEISGSAISTVSVGTEFIVVTDASWLPYATCEGLPINLIWKDEFEYLSQ